MLNAIIRFALTHRPLVLAACVVVLVYGGHLATVMPIDVFPDRAPSRRDPWEEQQPLEAAIRPSARCSPRMLAHYRGLIGAFFRSEIGSERAAEEFARKFGLVFDKRRL